MQKAIIKDKDDEILVWYTESINYNWMLTSYFFDIPGTVISATSEKGKNILSLISIKTLEDEKILINNWK